MKTTMTPTVGRTAGGGVSTMKSSLGRMKVADCCFDICCAFVSYSACRMERCAQ